MPSETDFRSGCQLIFPPFADPTWPYISPAALKGYLVPRGHHATVRDLNIEGLHHLASSRYVDSLRVLILKRFEVLNHRRVLSNAEEMEYLRLVEACDCFHDFGASLAGMTNGRTFFQQDHYVRNRNDLEDLFAILSAAHFPYRFGFNYANHLVAPWDFELLDHYIGNQMSPLNGFYEEVIDSLPPAGLIGISLTFVSQIPETFYLCSLIRKRIPGTFIVLGGSCIDQIMRDGRPEALERILSLVDGVVVQEGEKGLETLLTFLDQGLTFSPDRLAEVPNLVFRHPETGTVIRGPKWMLNMRESATPDYSDLDLSLYIAPEPMLLYSPSRGCYWNKCSFCSYGFSQSGRHDYREVPVEQAVSDLQNLQSEYGTDHFYLSCDVLAPAYAFDLAKGILAAGLDLYWSTDLRVEAAFTLEKCRLLYKSGLRTVALGVESGCGRMLKVMNKGITTDRIREVTQNFHRAGIAVSWMTILHHPGEQESESLETLSLLYSQRDYVDQFITGEFSLMPGSLIAYAPERYKITEVFYAAGDIFRQFPLYEMQTMVMPSKHPSKSRDLEQMLDELSRSYHLDHYPWAGSISTHHSFLYLLKFGQRIFAKSWPATKKLLLEKKHRLKDLKCRHSISLLQKHESQFFSNYLKKALSREVGTNLAPLSFNHFSCALEKK